MSSDGGLDHCDLLYTAWGVIANAYGGNWDQADPIWREAAGRWRDSWHEVLTEHCCAEPSEVES